MTMAGVGGTPQQGIISLEGEHRMSHDPEIHGLIRVRLREKNAFIV